MKLTVRAFWWWWAAVVAVALAWMGAGTPAGAPAADIAVPGLVPLPALPASAAGSAAALALLSESTLWGPRSARPAAAGASGAAAAAEAAKPAWVLSGVYTHGGQGVLVVHFDKLAQPSQQLRVGDRLPDGSLLRAIETDRVWVQPRGGSRRHPPKSVWLPVNRGLHVPDN